LRGWTRKNEAVESRRTDGTGVPKVGDELGRFGAQVVGDGQPGGSRGQRRLVDAVAARRPARHDAQHVLDGQHVLAGELVDALVSVALAQRPEATAGRGLVASNAVPRKAARSAESHPPIVLEVADEPEDVGLVGVVDELEALVAQLLADERVLGVDADGPV